jgi:hypothetical protein
MKMERIAIPTKAIPPHRATAQQTDCSPGRNSVYRDIGIVFVRVKRTCRLNVCALMGERITGVWPMDSLGIVILAFVAFTGLMGWLGNRR